MFFFLLCRQVFSQSIGDNSADLILYFKNIGKIAVIVFTPDMIAIGCIDQLRGDAVAELERDSVKS